MTHQFLFQKTTKKRQISEHKMHSAIIKFLFENYQFSLNDFLLFGSILIEEKKQ